MYQGIINFLLTNKVLVLGVAITYLSVPVIFKVTKPRKNLKLTFKDYAKLAVSFGCIFML